MFEHFTDDARRSIVVGQELARARGASAIETDDVLRAILDMRATLGTTILTSRGLDAKAMFVAIGTEMPSTSASITGHIPFVEHVKTVLVQALTASKSLGDEHVGTEHLVLGVLVAGGSRGWRHLRDAGVTADAYREAVEAETDRAQAGTAFTDSLHIARAMAKLAEADGPGALAEADAALAAARAEGDQGEQLALALNMVAWVVALTLVEPRFAEALALADQAVALQPDSEAFQGTRWAMLTVVGRGAEAIEGHQAILALGDDVLGADRGVSHSFLARSYLDIGDLDQARHHLREADRLGAPWPIHRDTWRRLDDLDGTWLPPSAEG